jgi:hypothetical protein
LSNSIIMHELEYQNMLKQLNEEKKKNWRYHV